MARWNAGWSVFLKPLNLPASRALVRSGEETACPSRLCPGAVFCPGGKGVMGPAPWSPRGGFAQKEDLPLLLGGLETRILTRV